MFRFIIRKVLRWNCYPWFNIINCWIYCKSKFQCVQNRDASSESSKLRLIIWFAWELVHVKCLCCYLPSNQLLNYSSYHHLWMHKLYTVKTMCSDNPLRVKNLWWILIIYCYKYHKERVQFRIKSFHGIKHLFPQPRV